MTTTQKITGTTIILTRAMNQSLSGFKVVPMPGETGGPDPALRRVGEGAQRCDLGGCGGRTP